MAEFPSQIAQINGAQTTQRIIDIVSQFSAKVTGPGGVLYSGLWGLGRLAQP